MSGLREKFFDGNRAFAVILFEPRPAGARMVVKPLKFAGIIDANSKSLFAPLRKRFGQGRELIEI